MAEDKDQQTEQPTQKRIDEARRKGNVLYSREVTNFLSLVVFAFIIGALSPPIMESTRQLLLPFIASPDLMAVDEKSVGKITLHTLLEGAAIIGLPILGILIVAIAGRVLQGSFIFSTESLALKWERLSPIAGFKKLFSLRSLVELLKSIVKLVIIGITAYLAVKPELQQIQRLPDATILTLLVFMGRLCTHLMIGILIAMFFIALFDYLYQRYEYIKGLKMSKQEVKDEYKQMEGDPKVKQKIKQLRMERAQKRMMADVPKSDVVITNPTHFSVALKYDSSVMQAPKVVAKGQDYIALKIREIAREHNVPIIQNAPLARALFASAEIDEEIPFTHYEAVAKIISQVYKLKGKKM